MLLERTKEILKKHGIRLSKRQGQSHIVDEKILRRMVDFARLLTTDTVLEVGPGIGNLTDFLVRSAGNVIAVERDERLIEILRDRFGDRKNLKIVQGDILKVELPEFNKVVANLPYSISSPLTFRLLERDFDLGVLMYQKEFAQRMVASPGSSDYGRLSVSVAYRARAGILEEVPPNAFIPQPEVRSAVVKLAVRDPPFVVRNEDIFFKTVRAAFQHRRQKLRNSLFNSFEVIFPETDFTDDQKREFIDKAVPKELLNSRAEELVPEEFGKIADSLDKLFLNYS